MANADDLFGRLSYVKPNSMYEGLPIDEMIQLGKNAHTNYEMVQSGFDSLQTELNSIDVDPLNKYIIDDINNTLNESIQSGIDNGNFHRMKNQLRQDVKNITNNELLKTARNERAVDLEYIKSIQDNKEIPMDTKNFLLNEFYKTKTAITQDENGNIIGSKAIRERIDKWYDIFGDIDTYIKNMPKDELFRFVNSGRADVLVSGKEEKLTEEEAFVIAKQKLLNSDKYKHQLNLMYRMSKNGNTDNINLKELVINQSRLLNTNANIQLNDTLNKLSKEEREKLTEEQKNNMYQDYYNKEVQNLLSKLGVEDSEILNTNPTINIQNLPTDLKNLYSSLDYDGFLNNMANVSGNYNAYIKQDFKVSDNPSWKHSMDMAKQKAQHDFEWRKLQEQHKNAIELKGLDFALQNQTPPSTFTSELTENSTINMPNTGVKTNLYDVNGNLVSQKDINYIKPDEKFDNLYKQDFQVITEKNALSFNKSNFSITKVNDYFKSNKATNHEKLIWSSIPNHLKSNIKNETELIKLMQQQHKNFINANKINPESYKTIIQKPNLVEDISSMDKSFKTSYMASPGSYEFYELRKDNTLQKTSTKLPTGDKLEDYKTMSIIGIVSGQPNMNFAHVINYNGKTYYAKNKNSEQNDIYQPYTDIKTFVATPSDNTVMTRNIITKDGKNLTIAIDKVYPKKNGKYTYTDSNGNFYSPKILYSIYNPETKERYYLNAPQRSNNLFDDIQPNQVRNIDGKIYNQNPIDFFKPDPNIGNIKGKRTDIQSIYKNNFSPIDLELE